MAALAQLEQTININGNLEKMIGAQSSNQIAALQLVGKNITADRAAIYHDKDKASPIKFKLPQDSSEVRLEVQNIAGETIRTINMGTQNEGDVQTKWDGMTEEGMPMPAGRYTYKIIAKDMEGKDVNINTKVEGRVSGVTSSAGTTFLLVGDQRIGLNDVEMIKEGTDEKGAAPATAAATPPLFGKAPQTVAAAPAASSTTSNDSNENNNEENKKGGE
jgi:flagellar basal-body rod modification protein FlgD